jgi:hypothetical protein
MTMVRKCVGLQVLLKRPKWSLTIRVKYFSKLIRSPAVFLKLHKLREIISMNRLESTICKLGKILIIFWKYRLKRTRSLLSHHLLARIS